MNWEAIGAVGEILGATAVVISLVYLAAQIRVQNREARLAAMHDIWESYRGAISSVGNLENAEVFVKANEDYDSLSEAERLMTISASQRVLRVFEEAYHQHREGRLDGYIWDVMVKQYAALLSSGSIGRVWELRKDFYSPDFRAFVEGLPRTQFRLR